MGYIPFARKYRPQTFGEMVGQDHIVTTLTNAIAMDRVAHAYIFSGPRGTGKTSTARLLSKSLNCEKGPTQTPCNRCQSCVEITGGSGMDVLEIDGASNRGIDEIRNLRDNVKFAPSGGAFKIYIIDEVHMLTPEAFNALLKTLEEPPPRVKFIFATTRINKIPATILSRCQRLDFRKISHAAIKASLTKIAKKEKLNVLDDALDIITRHSEGCLRDAEVLLDQLSTFGSGTIDAKAAARMLGTVDEAMLFGLADTIADKNPHEALKKVDALISDGKEAAGVLTGLIGHFRDLAVIKAGGSKAGLIDTSEAKRAQFTEQAQRFSLEDILYAVGVFSNAVDCIRKTHLERIPLEMAMVKLCRRGTMRSLDEILEKFNALEARLAKPNSSYQREIADSSSPPARMSGPAASSYEPSPPQEEEAGSEKSASMPSQKSVPPVSASGALGGIMGMWQAILDHLKSRKMSVASYLMHGRPVKADAASLTIGFPKTSSFHKETLEHTDNRRLVEAAVEHIMKRHLSISFVIVNEMKSTQVLEENGITGNAAGVARKEEFLQQPNSALGEPIVKDAMDIFKGEVVGFSKRAPKEKA